MRTYDVAAYIWPSYHHEPRLAHWWTEGDGEWYTVRRGTPRWEGHDMPKQPLLGYQDEADPAVMRQHVDIALAHGVNVFIMDWYWYDDAPCFERQLNDGLMPAVEGTDMRFYLMWANHDANSLWDMHTDAKEHLFSAFADRALFEKIWKRNIEKYFKHPNYYRIDDKPVLSVFLTGRLIADLGGPEKTREALDWLQEEARRQGLPGVHVQAIITRGLPQEVASADPAIAEMDMPSVSKLSGFESGTSYQTCQYGGHSGDFVQWVTPFMNAWPRLGENMTFFPHVSIGWDNCHRHPSMKEAVTGSTPWAFEACLHKAKMYLDERPEQVPLLTINSWNEWTEGSYLLPDLRWGYGFLEAVRNVFGSRS